jgi:hypothetical protein
VLKGTACLFTVSSVTYIYGHEMQTEIMNKIKLQTEGMNKIKLQTEGMNKIKPADIGYE